MDAYVTPEGRFNFAFTTLCPYLEIFLLLVRAQRFLMRQIRPFNILKLLTPEYCIFIRSNNEKFNSVSPSSITGTPFSQDCPYNKKNEKRFINV